MKKLILLSFGLMLAFCVSAQEFSAGYYSYLTNPFTVNPAYTGSSKTMDGILSVRSQQAGLQGAPRTALLGFHASINDMQGAGFRLKTDSRGAFQVLKFDATYGHRARINKDNTLRFGVSGGVVNKQFNINRINNHELLDQTDPNLSSSYYRSTNAFFGAGLLFQGKDLEIGLASPHLLENGSGLSSYVHASASYKLQLNSNINLTPKVFYNNLPVVRKQADFLAEADFRNLLMVMAGYRTNSTILAGFGARVSGFRFRYMYEYNSSVMSSIAGSSHEFMLEINLVSRKSLEGHDRSEP